MEYESFILVRADESGEQSLLFQNPDGSPQGMLTIKSKVAGLLADQYSIQHDLHSVIEYCDAFESMDRDDIDTTVVGALFEAAIIAYGRGFMTGKSFNPGVSRYKIEQEILQALTPEQQDAHSEILEMRNRHVGHRVDDRQQVKVIAAFNPDGSFADLSALSGSLGGDTRIFTSLHELASVLLELLSSRIGSLKDQVERECADFFSERVVQFDQGTGEFVVIPSR